MPIAVSGNFVWLQEGYFLSLHEQWPNIDGSIQAEAGIIFIFFQCHRTVISRSKEIPFRSINHKIYIRIQIPEIIPPNLFSGICHFHQIFFIVGQAPNAARNYYRTYCCSAIKTYLCLLERIHNQNNRKRSWQRAI